LELKLSNAPIAAISFNCAQEQAAVSTSFGMCVPGEQAPQGTEAKALPLWLRALISGIQARYCSETLNHSRGRFGW
jgi:hypothetical protein